MKKIAIEIGIAILFIAAIIVLSVLLFNSCSDKQSLTQSNSALFLQYHKADSLVKIYRTTTGMSAASVKITQATKADIKTGMHESVNALQSAGVNSNEITSIGTIQAKINIDSLKWSYQKKIDSLSYRCAFYSDSSLTALVCMKNDSITQSNISCAVPLAWATSDVQKKLWFITLPKWLFGIKERRFVVTTTSKYVQLTGVEYVEKK